MYFAWLPVWVLLPLRIIPSAICCAYPFTHSPDRCKKRERGKTANIFPRAIGRTSLLLVTRAQIVPKLPHTPSSLSVAAVGFPFPYYIQPCFTVNALRPEVVANCDPSPLTPVVAHKFGTSPRPFATRVINCLLRFQPS